MEEKIYKIMNRVGAWNLALGIIVLLIGISTGIGCIINGCVLLKNKSNITF